MPKKSKRKLAKRAMRKARKKPKIAPPKIMEAPRPIEYLLRCRDVGMQCDYEARGATTEEIMSKASEHARQVHGVTEIPPEMAEKVKAAIKPV